jgi:predicted permease
MNTFGKDLQYGFRGLLKSPLASLIAVFSLAAGIGVTSLVYSVMDGLFFRPLPIPKPREVVRLSGDGFSYPEYQEYQRQCRYLKGVAAVTSHGAVLRQGDQSHFVIAGPVSPNYFTVLGLRSILGSVFAERSNGQGSDASVVISYDVWKGFFSGDTNIIGKTVLLSDSPLTVVGVAPRKFVGVERFQSQDLWYPDDASSLRNPAFRFTYRGYSLLGRLAPGITRQQAQAEAQTIVRRVLATGTTQPMNQPVKLQSESEYGWEQGGLIILIVMPVVGLVLLVACANVSSLLLARNEQRRSELAMRSALGASRWRLIRQLLTESWLLAFGGMALALPFAVWAIRPVSMMILRGGVSLTDEPFPLDHRALVVTSLVALLSTVMAGLLPAIRATRVDLAPVLKGDAPAFVLGRWRFAGRSVLVIGQLALSLVFLAATGLLLIAFLGMLRLDPGFTTRELLVVSFFGLHKHEPAQVRTYYRDLAERLQSMPGILHTSFAAAVPYIDGTTSLGRRIFTPNNRQGLEVRANIVETNYFQTMGIRLVMGRSFGQDDAPGSRRVVLVNESLARKLWPQEDPVGKEIRLQQLDGPSATVIGVVRDIRQSPMEEQYQPFIYLSFRQEQETEAYLMVATSGKANAARNIVRSEMRALNRDVVPWRMETLEEGLWRRTSNAWAMVGLMSVLCGLTCVLSVSGLFGLVAYSVACRTQEFGVRMALGAQRFDTMKLVLRQGLLLGSAGAACGVLLALAVGGLMRHMLPGVPGVHFPLLAGATGLVLLVAALASLVPARQAMRIDPLRVLRCDR